MQVIDVSSWTLDEIYGSYPEGAREKRAIFPPTASLVPDFILPTRRYLYKRSHKYYPDQFWAEVVAYRVGRLLGVEVPPAYAACNSAEGHCGALIEWFYEDGKASFVAGGQYMQRMMPEFDRRKGELHNLQAVRSLGRFFSRIGGLTHDWTVWWHEAALFDALIGNSDRHQDNWGILIRKRKGIAQYALSPLFDNGTSLGHELLTTKVATWADDRYDFYIRRGRHHLRWSREDEKSCQHLDMLCRMQDEAGGSIPGLRQKLENFDIGILEAELSKLCQMEMLMPMTVDRKNLYIRLIALRRKRILEALK